MPRRGGGRRTAPGRRPWWRSSPACGSQPLIRPGRTAPGAPSRGSCCVAAMLAAQPPTVGARLRLWVVGKGGTRPGGFAAARRKRPPAANRCCAAPCAPALAGPSMAGPPNETGWHSQRPVSVGGPWLAGVPECGRGDRGRALPQQARVRDRPGGYGYKCPRSRRVLVIWVARAAGRSQAASWQVAFSAQAAAAPPHRPAHAPSC